MDKFVGIKLIKTHNRVGFLPAETYFCLDSGRNLVSHGFIYFLPAEMRETQGGISRINMLEIKGIQDN